MRGGNARPRLGDWVSGQERDGTEGRLGADRLGQALMVTREVLRRGMHEGESGSRSDDDDAAGAEGEEEADVGEDDSLPG